MTVVWRSGWAVLAAGALVASLLAVGANPAGADTDEADNKAGTAACVGDALGDQMFTDVSDDHAFVDAINCVAYYEITNGTGDGSAYSPNNNVTRAEMAVFVARAAGAAGVDLGDAMDEGFTDIDDVWGEAQDAINQLAGKGIISGGGDFRPDDDITRAEMASFLIGLLAKASSEVTILSSGEINLGTGGDATNSADWDYFGDVRASLPRANDAEISALYELGVTNGASAAAGAEDGEAPLDTNYEADGTVNRGEMAAFITRALGHTSVRPAGISVQYDSGTLVASARDENFQPTSNVEIDLFTIDTDGIDLAFRGNGSCGEVDKIEGKYRCEIDGTDPITGGDGDTSATLDPDGAATTVWAWTGDDKDTASEDMDGLFRLDIPEGEDESMAGRVRISTEHGGSKAHLGSSVLYTVQLEDADGAVSVGTDGEKSASFLVTLTTYAIIENRQFDDTAEISATNMPLVRNPQGASVAVTLPLTTDSDGKATFSVAANLPDTDKDDPRDKYSVDVHIQPSTDGNAPAVVGPNAETPPNGFVGNYYIGKSETGAQPVGGDLSATFPTDARDAAGNGNVLAATVTFSTEDSDRSEAVVSVEPLASYAVADGRGASNRVKVTVTDQYGDPIVGAKVKLTTAEDLTGDDDTDDDDETTVLGNDKAFAVGRDGSYTFGYDRERGARGTETFTAAYDHDGDGCSATDITDGTNSCDDLDAEETGDQPGTAPIMNPGAADDVDDVTVEWASGPRAADNSVSPAVPDELDQDTAQTIRQFDTDTNTIFAGEAGNTFVVGYDSNDRFNDADGAITYAKFEKSLAKGKQLTWDIVGSGSRAVNSWTLTDA